MHIRDQATNELPYGHCVYMTKAQGDFLRTEALQSNCSINAVVRELIETGMNRDRVIWGSSIKFKKNGRRA